MGMGRILRKAAPQIVSKLEKISPSTNTQGGLGGIVRKSIPLLANAFKKLIPSTPESVDVSAEGMKKKNLARGTGVIYSGVRTTSRGLLTDVKLEKKTLLGG